MIIHNLTSSNRARLLGGILIGVGIIIGFLLNQSLPHLISTLSKTSPSSTYPLHPTLQHAQKLNHPTTNDLQTLSIELPQESTTILNHSQQEAMSKYLLTKENKSWVRAEITVSGKTLQAEVRLKGDLADHFRTDQWSFRIRLLDGHFMGMRVFSIQHPETRGFLWEWVVHEAARYSGLIAPRGTFINVMINGNSSGIYYLEEHFAKELLESHHRREGPIVRFLDQNYWDTQLPIYSHTFGTDIISDILAPAFTESRTMVVASNEKVFNTDSLNNQLHLAIQQMRVLQQNMLIADDYANQQTKLMALNALRENSIEEALDIVQTAKAHAFLTLFQAGHALHWFNQRYYFNPITLKLEPIIYDCNAQDFHLMPDLAIALDETSTFGASKRYYNQYFHFMGTYSSPKYLDEIWDKIKTQLNQFETALTHADLLPEDFSSSAMRNRLHGWQADLRPIIFPTHAVNFATDFIQSEVEGGSLHVRAWTVTRQPVEIREFVFGNGVSIPAILAVKELETEPWAKGIVIPGHGQPVHFKIRADERLSQLRNIKEIKKAIRNSTNVNRNTRLELSAVYRPLSASRTRRERLYIRTQFNDNTTLSARPTTPTLQEILELHPFLSYDFEAAQLSISKGIHKVIGDLVIPEGVPVHAKAGTSLLFNPGAVLLSHSPLILAGTETDPIRLTSVAHTSQWAGIVLLETGNTSTWSHVEMSNTSGIHSNGWTLSGGATFYHAPSILHHCLFSKTNAEDALNIFGSKITATQCRFESVISDAFDGDFITGSLHDCSFNGVGSDGIDVSGSHIHVERCEFANIGDKAFSIGERSHANLIQNKVHTALIGVAAKDLSNVVINNLSLEQVSSFALAAFIKKDEYGPSSIQVKNLLYEHSKTNNFLSQKGCTIEINGKLIPTQNIDVQALYQKQVLGL